jgi:DNA polymerase-3 subunit alpha
MAFIKIEDKTEESEIIVFPNLYEQIGTQLLQDTVIRVTGKVTARDREGNMTSDVKMIADDIQIVDDHELRNYESHGKKMSRPNGRATVTATRNKFGGKKPQTKTSAVSTAKSKEHYTVVADVPIKKMYVHIKDPENQDALLKVKQACSQFPGVNDIVLVLGEGKKSAIKMPFKVDGSDQLVGTLVKILDEDAVVIK